MEDEQQTTGGNNTAADKIKTTGDVFEAAREYKQTKDALEALEKQEAQAVFVESMPQDAQEPQETGQKQRIFNDSGIEIDPKTGNYIIRIDTTIDPELQAKLDPNSPQFDPALYLEHTKAAKQRLQASLEQMRNSLLDIMKASFGADTMQGVVETLQDAIAPLADIVKQTVTSDGFKRITETLQYIVENNEAIQANLEKWEQLEPYLEAELQKPEYNGLTLDELIALDETDENGEPIENSLFERALAAAQAAFDAEQLPRITVNGRGASDVEYPLDKVNANIWTLLKDAPKNGQLSFTIGTEKRGSRKQADIIYSINFEELENAGLNTVKRLTAFDKRVYIATSALFNGSSDYMTVSQIYATMGNESRPNARDIEKIYTSLEKMRRLPITLDNFTSINSEAKTYPNMPKFVYNGVLLPWESIDAVVNGQRADGVIHLFREPPLVSFAKERKQVTTVSRKLLASPISKTDAHLLIDDYLIERISHIKNSKGKISNKLLYSTIFDKTGTTSRCQKSRGKETVVKYLEHYKQCGFIKDYKEAADGVTIIY